MVNWKEQLGTGKGGRGAGECTWMRMMSAPASASEMAMWAPMPRVPPVTTAVRPSREKMEGREGAIVEDLELRVGDGVYEWWLYVVFATAGVGVFEDGGTRCTLTLDPAP